jgi:hypothetical protein
MTTPESTNDVRGYIAAFGEPVTIRGEVIRGIVSNEYQQSEFGQVRIQSNAPQLTLSWEDADRVGVALNDAVKIDSVMYEIREVMPDGHKGLTRYRLIEQ